MESKLNDLQVSAIFTILLVGEKHPQYQQARKMAEDFVAEERKARTTESAERMSKNPVSSAWTR